MVAPSAVAWPLLQHSYGSSQIKGREGIAMERMVCHYWVLGTDGKSALYELDYYRYPIRDGAMCHVKVHNSERPCHCPEREIHERRLAASMN